MGFNSAFKGFLRFARHLYNAPYIFYQIQHSLAAVTRNTYTEFWKCPAREQKMRKPTYQMGRACQDTALGFIQFLFLHLAGVTPEL
jgi:hypothetical protein